MGPAQQIPCFECGLVSRALPGQEFSGDQHLFMPTSQGMLAAVVDGLGHGREATAAARAAIDMLAEHADESVINLVERCHQALRATRGAAMTLGSFNQRDETLTTVGIGNVEAVLLRANPATNPQRESVLLRGGVVGYQLPALYASVFPVFAGDLLLFATDGVRSGFSDAVNRAEPVQALAEKLFAKNFHGGDDALILVIRYLGKSRG